MVLPEPKWETDEDTGGMRTARKMPAWLSHPNFPGS